MSHLSFPITSFYSESIYRLAEPSGLPGAWEQRSASVVDDAITVTGPGMYEISPEDESDDIISTILGGDAGDEIVLYSDGAAVVTIKHNVDNIQIGYDFQCNTAYDQIRLVKRADGQWVGGGLNDNAA